MPRSMLRALAGLPRRGSAPLDFPPSPVAGAAWERYPAAPACRIGGAQRQGFASPSSSLIPFHGLRPPVAPLAPIYLFSAEIVLF